MGHASFIWDVTHSYGTSHTHQSWLDHIWCDSCIVGVTHSYGTWLIHMGRDSFIWEKPYTSVVTRSYLTWFMHIWHDSFIRDMTHSYVTPCVYGHTATHCNTLQHTATHCNTRDSFICHTLCPCADKPRRLWTWLIHVGHDSFIWNITHSSVTPCVHDSFMWDMTHYLSHLVSMSRHAVRIGPG